MTFLIRSTTSQSSGYPIDFTRLSGPHSRPLKTLLVELIVSQKEHYYWVNIFFFLLYILTQFTIHKVLGYKCVELIEFKTYEIS